MMFRTTIRGSLQVIGILTMLAFIAGIAIFPFLVPWLQYEDLPKRADYIVPLAGDWNRVIKAAELYRQGLAPKIILSNEVIGTAERWQEIAAKLGYPSLEPLKFRQQLLDYFQVPHDAIDSFGHELISTMDEAEALKLFLGDRTGTVILVTSPYQARRAKIIFEKVMPGVHWVILWPDEESLSERWWTDQSSARVVIIEAAKLMYYWAGGSFRNISTHTNK